MNTSKWLDNVPMGPADPILGLNEKFNADVSDEKVNLGIGAYRDDNGKPYLLPSVVEAEKKLLEANVNKEYSTIIGMKEFIQTSLSFAYGNDCAPLKEGRVLGMQALSGTGACRIAGEFFAKFLGKGHPIRLPNPTWGNHMNIFRDCGLDVGQYRYYNAETRSLDLNGLLEDIQTSPERTVFLLHACAHNPTGVDPSQDQWKQISEAMKAKNQICFFDCAYQGFASGDADKDAWAIRYFASQGHQLWLAQSYAKNFGLYGERIGCLSYIAKDKEEMSRVVSQVKLIIRPMYSNPPIHGAHLVRTILSDEKLSKQWYAECRGMADRIMLMRTLLKTNLEKLTANKRINQWNHITDQIGMFCFTGLTVPEVEQLIAKYHIYLTKNGRISMAGVTQKNVEYIAQSIAAVL